MTKPRVVFLPHANLQYSQLPPQRRLWVIENTYEKLFDLIAHKGYRIGFEASGFTVDAIAELCPRAADKMKGLIRDGLMEPVASPYIHIMLSNVDPLVGMTALKDGIEAWHRHTNVAPTVGWNPECAWAHFIPEIFKQAGLDTLVMDGDSFFLSFEDIRRATGLKFDVTGHSNKGKLFLIEKYIKDKDEYLRYLTNPSVAPNGLKLIFRSDMMANPMLWYLMGATEGVREQPIALDEIREMLASWKDRIARTGSFIMPFAEDAEYIGSSAYFYVKQFAQARFFESEPQSVERFAQMLQVAGELGYELARPCDVLRQPREMIDNSRITEVENGIAWHGGTAKAWANTPHACILDPTCRMVLDGIAAVAAHSGKSMDNLDGPLLKALRDLTASYVSDCRWPPAPTSPGRFNVVEGIKALESANAAIGEAMQSAGISHLRGLYSPQLMATQIQRVNDTLMGMQYFGE